MQYWLDEPKSIQDNAHEARFVVQPSNGLPVVNSKVRRSLSPVKIKSQITRKDPVIDLVTNELIQVKECENPNFYNYDLDKTLLNPIAKNLTFYKEKRFTNKGIFGDLYDPNKNIKFGSGGESILDTDRAVSGKMTMIKPRITEQKSFDNYVARDCSIMEATIGTKLVCNIPTDKELKLMSVNNLKAY